MYAYYLPLDQDTSIVRQIVDTNCRYKFKNDELLCQICGQREDNQPHLLQCKTLSKYFESEEKVVYNDMTQEGKKL